MCLVCVPRYSFLMSLNTAELSNGASSVWFVLLWYLIIKLYKYVNSFHMIFTRCHQAFDQEIDITLGPDLVLAVSSRGIHTKRWRN